jgi:hypothetical protein
MSHPGRNDSCPCGSGKKFKRCCALNATVAGNSNAAPFTEASSSPANQGEPVAGWARAHAIWPKTRKALTDHAVEWLGEQRLHEAFEEAPFMDLPEDERPHWFEPLLSWQLYDWIPDGETQTVAAHWLTVSGRASVRDADVVQMIRSADEQPASFYQVQAVDRGRGAVLRDLLTGAEGFVVDRSMSESVRPWAVLFARLVETGGLTIFDAVGPRVLTPDWASELAAAAEEEFGVKLPLSRDELRPLGTELADLYVSAVLEDDRRRAQPMALHNTDGHELVLCTETWRIASGKREAVLARVRELGVEAADDGDGPSSAFVWLSEADDDSSGTVLGRVVVDATEVVLEANSRERRDRLKAELVQAIRGIAKHARSDERPGDELVELARRSPPDKAVVGSEERSRVPPEVEAEVLREYVSNYYSSWPDSELPALGGKTPRAAVRTKRGRAEVESLIRDMEHHSHGSLVGAAYDFDELRRALGLPAARSPLG